MFRSLTVVLMILVPQILFAECASTHFKANPDGTVYDEKTGLTWMACSYGQRWNDGSCDGVIERLSWRYAKTIVIDINTENGFAGKNDWRLPDVEELNSLVHMSCKNPSIDTTFFPNTAPTGYWSGTPNKRYDKGAELVFFLYGGIYMSNKNTEWAVRLVRK